MFLDSSTLRDLEIIPTPPVRDVTLWSLLNRTRTRAGAEALRAHLLHPPHDIPTILEFQRAHQEVSSDASGYRQLLDSAAADQVERYLNLSWQLPRDMPPLSRFRRWHRQYLEDAVRGRELVTSLLDSDGGLRR